MRLLVTGVTGFIGRRLLRRLAEERPRWTVYGIGRDPARLARCAAILPGLRAMRCDLETQELELDDPVDVVVHLASWVALPREDSAGWERLLHTNTRGTIRVWRWIQHAATRPSAVIHASSVSAYGEPRVQPAAEDDATEPSSFYGLSKLGAELYGNYFSSALGVPTVNLRIGYVYGPEDDSGKVIYKWAAAARTGAPITIGSSPHVFRDYVFVDDVTRVLVELAAAPTLPAAALNVSPGRGITLLQLARTLQRLGSDRAPLHVQPTPGDHFAGCVIQSRARFDALFPGFRFTELEDGLRRLWE